MSVNSITVIIVWYLFTKVAQKFEIDSSSNTWTDIGFSKIISYLR